MRLGVHPLAKPQNRSKCKLYANWKGLHSFLLQQKIQKPARNDNGRNNGCPRESDALDLENVLAATLIRYTLRLALAIRQERASLRIPVTTNVSHKVAMHLNHHLPTDARYPHDCADQRAACSIALRSSAEARVSYVTTPLSGSPTLPTPFSRAGTAIFLSGEPSA